MVTGFGGPIFGGSLCSSALSRQYGPSPLVSLRFWRKYVLSRRQIQSNQAWVHPWWSITSYTSSQFRTGMVGSGGDWGMSRGGPFFMNLLCVWQLVVLDTTSVVQLCSILVEKTLGFVPLDGTSKMPAVVSGIEVSAGL